MSAGEKCGLFLGEVAPGARPFSAFVTQCARRVRRGPHSMRREASAGPFLEDAEKCGRAPERSREVTSRLRVAARGYKLYLRNHHEGE